MPNASKREKREKKLPVKEEIGGESKVKPVFQINVVEMQKEIDVVVVIRGGSGEGGKRN